MILAALVTAGSLPATAWTAWAAVATVLLVLCGAAIRLVSKFSALVTSVEALNHNISRIAESIGDHEHRISMLEGVERVRELREK